MQIAGPSVSLTEGYPREVFPISHVCCCDRPATPKCRELVADLHELVKNLVETLVFDQDGISAVAL